MIYLPGEMIVEIPISKGYTAIVDLIDGDLLAHNWVAHEATNTVYAERKRPAGETGSKLAVLHRIVMARVLGRELATSERVDHIDRNGLNNRRSNLRLATHAENQRNRPKQSNNTSGFKGVCFDKARRKWIAQITVNGKTIRIGRFNTPEEAHAAYAVAAQKYHGKFAYTK